MQKAAHPSSLALNILIFVLGTLLLVLGIWGFLDLHHHLHATEPVTVANVVIWIYDSFKIALFHGHTEEEHLNWQLRCAVALSLGESLAVTAWGALTIFPEHVARMLFPFRRGHVVICGLNRRALQLALAFREENATVAVIEKDPANPLLESCRHHGALVFAGEATDGAVLRNARIHAAKHLVAFCSTDSTNVDIAAAAEETLKHFPPRHTPVQCHIHIVDFALLTWLRRNKLMASREQRHIHMRLFDCFEISARLLLNEFPLDRQPIRTLDDPRQVHLVIAGFGRMAEALALETAKQCHFANVKKPRITVIDRQARRKEHAFLNRFPQFGEVCDYTFIEAHADDPAVIDAFKKWSAEPDTLETIAVCFDSDSDALACALGLRRIAEPAGVPIRVRMSTKSGLAHLLGGAAKDDGGLFTPFGMIDDVCTPGIALDEEINRFARDIHQGYCKNIRPDQAVPWDLLDPDLRDSNVQQSQHTDVKLRAIGCVKSKTPMDGCAVVDAFTPEEIELLGRMEHARWNAERFLACWTLDRSLKKKDLKTKRTPYLVGWDELSEEVKGWDRDMAAQMPKLLKWAGYVIYRKQ